MSLRQLLGQLEPGHELTSLLTAAFRSQTATVLTVFRRNS
jgi:hypothetical protein